MLDDLVPLIYSYVRPTPEQQRIWRIKKIREATVNEWKDDELDRGYALIKMYMVSYIADAFLEELCDPDDGVYEITTEENVGYKFNEDPWLYQNIIDDDISFKEQYLDEQGFLNDGEWKTIEHKINLVTYLLACELWGDVERAEEELEPVNIND